MPISLRLPPEKEKIIRQRAARAGQTKTALILEALDEKLGLKKSKAQIIRETAGWLTKAETDELREAVAVFDSIDEGDWT